uniref:Oxidoreductase-like domain-containing protein n=1 Tax=Nelumbo nucifera TaxID=4432 RepID=A0A822ZAB4_NELNU|nr:TPA_asm: hypothetical protein HUJ06_014708 [Nelumbo nucifera]
MSLRRVAVKAVNPIPYRNQKASCPPRLLRYLHDREVAAEMVYEVKKNQQDMLIENKEEDINKDNQWAAENFLPPPEKPLLGDCCGSGCIRCVWDVYHEELEDYNNRYRKYSQFQLKKSK